MHGQMYLFLGVHSYSFSFNTFADNLCVTVVVRGQSDQKQDKLIAMAISPCTEKEEFRTPSTQMNGITCSTEYQHKMKGQCTGNQRAEITSTKLLFCFVIKSKLAQMDECVISAIMSTRNLKENSFSIEKEMVVCHQFSQSIFVQKSQTV